LQTWLLTVKIKSRRLRREAGISAEPQQSAKNRSGRVISSCVRSCEKILRRIGATCAVLFGWIEMHKAHYPAAATAPKRKKM
jgi:hypothetical protein